MTSVVLVVVLVLEGSRMKIEDDEEHEDEYELNVER